MANFLTGLGNLGEIAQGYQAFQARALQQQRLQEQLAQEQQQQQALQQLYPVLQALQQQPGGIQGMAGAPGGLYQGAPPGAAPITPVQTAQLPDLTAGAPGAPSALPQVGGAAAGLYPDQPAAPTPGYASTGYAPAPSGGFFDSGLPAALKQTVVGLEGARPGQIGAYGEEGKMQVLPATEERMGFPRGTALYSDAPGDAYLGKLYRESGGNVPATLAGYNRGEGGMRQYQAGGLAAMHPAPAPAYAAAIRQVEQTGQVIGRSAGPQVATETTQGATSSLQNIDPSQIGRAAISDVVKAIDQAIPEADPKIKSLVAMQLMHILAPADQMMMKYMLQRDRDNIQLQVQGMRDVAAAGRTEAQIAARGEIEASKQQFKAESQLETERFKAEESAKTRAAREQLVHFIEEERNQRQQKAIQARNLPAKQEYDALKTLYKETANRINQLMQSHPGQDVTNLPLYKSLNDDLEAYQLRMDEVRGGMAGTGPTPDQPRQPTP